MKKMVSEDIHDFLDPEEVDPELSAIEAVEDDDFPEDENGEEYIEIENPMDRMKKVFRAEIAAPEFSRITFLLDLKDGRSFEGTPMAELSSGDFLFKVEGQIKKIKLSDILKFDTLVEEEPQEEVNEKFSKAKFVRESEEEEEEEEELCSQCGQDYVYQDDLCLDCFNEREDEMRYEEENEEE